MKAQLIVPAAGMGLRLKRPEPKALADLEGTALLVHTLRRFAPLGLLHRAIVLGPPTHLDAFEHILEQSWPGETVRIVPGGVHRQESVWNGLEALEDDMDIVVIHDAARPFVERETIEASIEAATKYGAATVAMPSIDTILIGDDAGFLVETPDRRRLWACQTPQTFRTEVIRAAHRAAQHEDFTGTDDASLVRRAGGAVKLVPGSRFNIKVTTPEDFELARMLVARKRA